MSTAPAAQVRHCSRAQPWPVPLGLQGEPSLHRPLLLPLAPPFIPMPVATAPLQALAPLPLPWEATLLLGWPQASWLGIQGPWTCLAQLTLQGLTDFICEIGPSPPALPSLGPHSPLVTTVMQGGHSGAEGKPRLTDLSKIPKEQGGSSSGPEPPFPPSCSPLPGRSWGGREPPAPGPAASPSLGSPL